MFQKFIIGTLLMIGSINVAWGEACSAVIKDYVDWIKSSNEAERHSVSFEMVISERPAKWVSYTKGELKIWLGTGLFASKVETTFSDRSWCPKQGTGQESGSTATLCTSYQNFDYKKPEKWSLGLNPSKETLGLNFHSWNQKFDVKLTCKNQFLYGHYGQAMVVLNLKKASHPTPK